LTKLLYDLSQTTADYDSPCTNAGCKPGETLGDWRLRLWPRQTAVYYEKATFLKLRELSVSVDLPQSFVRRFWGGARYIRLGLSGHDLLSFTPYSGFDPEVSSIGNQPIGRNQDNAPYPPSRSFWFSVDVGF